MKGIFKNKKTKQQESKKKSPFDIQNYREPDLSIQCFAELS